jgi:predicted helicase
MTPDEVYQHFLSLPIGATVELIEFGRVYTPLSQLLIQHYLNDLQTLRQVSGTSQESVVREAFKTLLKDWGKSRDLIFLPEYEYETLTKTRVRPDGTLMYALRVPFGYWEAKDTDDDLDEEIEKKFRKGYPQDNIIFDDSHDAVLIQNKQQVMRCGVEDPAQLQKLLELYFGYERPEIADFRDAVEQFKADLPAVLTALREMIEAADRDNPAFHQAAIKFLKHAQETINPNVVAADVREMLIQHILTEEIFSQVFDNSDFHHHNNVAKQLYALEETFFAGSLKQKTLAGLRPYYAAIKSAAALVSSHHEKQTFLKVIYENFYKVYDKKKADRLGVAYTPNEIVRFMVEAADWLCQKNFGKALIDKNVEILDPCAGTGTFITEIIEHFRGQPTKLRYKYLEELNCNEVAILPYYVANLNIEATYAAIAQTYEEYPNLCFVDTLDNTAALTAQKGQHFGDLFGGMSEENVARISRQNKKKISVIIGNPPYNANQFNENENNKNREYPEIDRRIKVTYIAASNARKTKLYDMYARFFRWASDRVDENGIVAFITNRSFIDSRPFDGFRKMIAEEFNDIYVVDLGGDVRADSRLSGTKNNVFGIQTGVAISFLVKRAKTKTCRIHYARRPQMETAEEKLAFLATGALNTIAFDEVRPNGRQDWINQSVNDFDTLVPIADKETKSTKIAGQERAVFKLFSLGVVTNRDDWAYADDEWNLRNKMKFLIDVYNSEVGRLSAHARAEDVGEIVNKTIKWTRAVKNDLLAGRRYEFNPKSIQESFYRPFVKRKLYFDRHLNEMLYQIPQLFGPDAGPNTAFAFSAEERSEFGVIAFNAVPNKDIFMPSAAQVLARYRYLDGKKLDNITDWALDQIHSHYDKGKTRKRAITKDAIFHYVYGVLHDPIYREKYALSLKREFPRIPFYADIWRWADWGEKLMALHIGYETVEPWPLQRIDVTDEKSRKAGLAPKAMLKANKETGIIQLDSETQLTSVPPEAWAYKLGNRSALEWILDQYKEKMPKDPTIREKFNTYRFADHKEKVVDLLKRVTRVSVETMKIVEAMRKLDR